MNWTKPFVVFTDGACKGNPGAGAWAFIILSPDNNVYEKGSGDAHTTNNKMELQAAIEALSAIPTSAQHVTLHTDSSYLISGITDWSKDWIARDWTNASGKPVANKEQWQELVRLSKLFEIDWHHVAAHSGIPGNERADTIASSIASQQSVDLFEGEYEDYDVDLFDLKPSSKASRKGSPSTGSVFYLSLVGGELLRHETWDECSKRVRGVSGAKYKKVKSQAEANEILKAWGVAEY